MFPSLIEKFTTELVIENGWKDIFVHTFNQRGMLEVVPGYNSKLSDNDRVTIDERIPTITEEVTQSGLPTVDDEIIFKHLGNIIGPPQRGLRADIYEEDDF